MAFLHLATSNNAIHLLVLQQWVQPVWTQLVPFLCPETIKQAKCPGKWTAIPSPTLSLLQQVGLLQFSSVWMPLFQKASGP